MKKWIHDLNVRSKTIKILEEKIEQKLYNIGFGNDFLNMTPKAQAMKEKIDKSDFVKIKKKYVHHQILSTGEKGNNRMGENICRSYIC